MSANKITVIRCRGIAEPMSKNMLSLVTDRLPKDRFEVIELVWSASYGAVPRWDGESFGVSVAAAETALLQLISDSDRCVLVGFSGGAEVVGNVAALLHRTKDVRLLQKVQAVGLLADPSRETSQIVGRNRGGQGITGGRYIPASHFPVWQMSAPGDPISELPFGNLLGLIAPATEFWSLKDPGAWMRDLQKKARAGQFKFWQNIFMWGQAYQWSRGYTHDRRHSCYHYEKMQGSDQTYTEKLAELIAGVR